MDALATKTTETTDSTEQLSKSKMFSASADTQISLKNRSDPGSSLKVKQTDLMAFTTQLSIMLDSGVILSDALDVIARQSERGNFKFITLELSEAVKRGENFSKGLAAFPKVFSPMFISMVKASEASGKMVEMLRILSGYLDFETETKRRIKGALAYPFIMALMAVAATGTLMLFVLPRFSRIYELRGASLPKLAQILVSISLKFADFRFMTVAITTLVLFSTALWYWFATTRGQRVIDYIKIRTPIIGTMFIDLVITRSMRILATMINTGVSLLDSLEVLQDACDNYYFKQLWARTDEKIRDGYQFSESIALVNSSNLVCSNFELVDQGIIHMLRAGEKSGMLGHVSDKISIFYEKKLQASIKNVTALIEPLMIIILGGIIGTIAIALLLPVFKISSVIAH